MIGPLRYRGARTVSYDWEIAAACRDEDADDFFSSRYTTFAKAICARCPVVQECLAVALDRGEEFGVWGGLDKAERRRVVTGEQAPPGPPVCGTSSAFRRHILRGEPVDTACFDARTTADKAWEYGFHRRTRQARR